MVRSVVVLTMAAPALSMMLAGPAAAQDERRAPREREALRRVQQALKSSEAQREALLRDKEAWAKDKAALDAELQLARSQAVAGLQQLQAERGRGAQLQSTLRTSADAAARTVQQWKQALQAADARAADTADKLARTQALLDERGRTLAAVNALLERSTQRNLAAEEKNRRLQALGRSLIEQVRSRTATEPVLGFGRVELENWAEDQRDRLEAERLPASR